MPAMDVRAKHNVRISGRDGAQPMLFSHGFGCDQNMWRHVAPAFEDRYQVITFDHVGAGGSDSAAYDVQKYSSLDGYASDVVDIVRELDLRDVVFVGHSVSSMIGALAEITEPDRFASLVMVGPSPRYIDDDDYVGGFSEPDIHDLLDSLGSNYLGWSSAMAPVIVGNADRPELGQELTESFCRMDPEVARRFATTTFLSDSREDLPRISTPTLVLQCSSDVIAPQAVGEYVARTIPERHAGADGGHRALPQPERSRRDDRCDHGLPRAGRPVGPPMPKRAAADAFHDALLEDDPVQLYEEAPCGYLSTTPDGRIVKTNQTFLRWTGYQTGALLGRPLVDLLTAGGRIYHETHYAPMLRMQGRVREIAVDIVRSDGERLPVLLNASVGLGDDGEPRVVRVAVFDATERRNYERELVLAKERAQRSEEKASTLAQTLQQSLIPPGLPAIPGLRLAADYRPAGDGSQVGGDFYDVLPLDRGRWCMLLGDVSGKGAQAAVVTTLCRYTARALAFGADHVSEVLTELNQVLCRNDTERFVTITVAILDPGRGRLAGPAGRGRASPSAPGPAPRDRDPAARPRGAGRDLPAGRVRGTRAGAALRRVAAVLQRRRHRGPRRDRGLRRRAAGGHGGRPRPGARGPGPGARRGRPRLPGRVGQRRHRRALRGSGLRNGRRDPSLQSASTPH